jgi:hypothetical protein
MIEFKKETKGVETMSEEQAIKDFSKTLIPNVCTIIELTGNEALKETIKQAIFDRRDAFLNTLNERKRNDERKEQTFNR